jgi:hypothetical protein
MAPVLVLIVKPDGVEEYIPPDVPTLVTDCADETLTQYPA